MGLKRLHKGEDIDILKREFGDSLKEVSPVEIAIIEQELIKEGISVNEILKLCDLHVKLFKETLINTKLKEVPIGHLLDLLMHENKYLLKLVEALTMYISALRTSPNSRELLEEVKQLIGNLYQSLRLHYRKNQMLLFPYLERRGIIAVPRVLWGCFKGYRMKRR